MVEFSAVNRKMGVQITPPGMFWLDVLYQVTGNQNLKLTLFRHLFCTQTHMAKWYTHWFQTPMVPDRAGSSPAVSILL